MLVRDRFNGPSSKDSLVRLCAVSAAPSPALVQAGNQGYPLPAQAELVKHGLGLVEGDYYVPVADMRARHDAAMSPFNPDCR